MSFDASFDSSFAGQFDVPPLDLIALALSRLPQQYRGTDGVESNTQKIIRALLAPAPQLEQAMRDVLLKRGVETAIGVQLDALGKLVGRPRTGLGGDEDDEVYRRYVRAQIATNRSNGTVRDKIKIARLVLGSTGGQIVVNNLGNGATILRIEGIAVTDVVADILIAMLIRGTSGGVRQILEYSTVAPTTVGRWTTQGTWGTAVWAHGVDKEF